jgi:hypothetical protein
VKQSVLEQFGTEEVYRHGAYVSNPKIHPTVTLRYNKGVYYRKKEPTKKAPTVLQASSVLDQASTVSERKEATEQKEGSRIEGLVHIRGFGIGLDEEYIHLSSSFDDCIHYYIPLLPIWRIKINWKVNVSSLSSQGIIGI